MREVLRREKRLCHNRLLSDRNAATYRKPLSDISSVEPAFLIDCFSCSLGILEIPFEDVGAFDANLREEEEQIRKLRGIRDFKLTSSWWRDSLS